MYESLTTRLARVPDDTILLPRSPLLARALGHHGRDPADELRLPPRFGPGVDGHVRPVSRPGPSGSPAAAPLDDGDTVVVVGASLAGLRAAETLRAEGFGGRLVLVGDGAPPPLRPSAALQAVPGRHVGARARRAAPTREARRAAGSTCVSATGRSRSTSGARRLGLDDGTLVDVDGVVLATGAHPRRLRGHRGARRGSTCCGPSTTRPGCASTCWPPDGPAGGGGGGRVHRVRGGGDVRRPWAARSPWSRRWPCPWSRCSATRWGRRAARCTPGHGVDLRTGVGVAAVHRPATTPTEAEGAAGRVELADGSSVPADVVVVGIGVRADHRLARGLGPRARRRRGLRRRPVRRRRRGGRRRRGPLGLAPAGGGPVRIEHWQRDRAGGGGGPQPAGRSGRRRRLRPGARTSGPTSTT